MLHVSLHDVCPPFEHAIDDAIALSAAVGLRPALLVVPDHHGSAPLEQHPRFVDKVRAWAEAGHEIYLHGLTHRAEPGPRSVSRWFRQRVVSAGEAEFASLDLLEAERRIREGVQRLEALGLPIHGFVAPAWSFPRWLLPVLASHGIRYTEDHLRVYDPVAHRRRASLVLNFASRTLGRKLSTTAYCRDARPLASLWPTTRVALHPGDVTSRLLRHEVRSLLAWASEQPAARGHELLA